MGDPETNSKLIETKVERYLGILISNFRNRGDAIQFFKFNEGYKKAICHHPNSLTNSLQITGPAGRIRGEKHRLARQYTKNCDQRDNFFTNRIL